jgi:hypothetical protein
MRLWAYGLLRIKGKGEIEREALSQLQQSISSAQLRDPEDQLNKEGQQP